MTNEKRQWGDGFVGPDGHPFRIKLWRHVRDTFATRSRHGRITFWHNVGTNAAHVVHKCDTLLINHDASKVHYQTHSTQINGDPLQHTFNQVYVTIRCTYVFCAFVGPFVLTYSPGHNKVSSENQSL